MTEQPDQYTDTNAYSQVPMAMRIERRWVNHRTDKVPCDNSGTPIDATNPANWLSFEEAKANVQNGGSKLGLGFALGDGWQGIDLDNVELNGSQELANSLPGYVEYSPSGRGCHAIGHGAPFPALRLKGIEAYSSGRYFTVTGNAIGGELCDLAPFFAARLQTLRVRPAGNAPVEPPSSPTQPVREIVERLMANPRHAALYGGDLTDAGGDHSRADLDLCNVLALLSCTRADVEATWLASPLGQRDKTQKRAEYRRWTLDKAFGSKPRKLASVDTSSLSCNGVPLFEQTPAATPAATPADTPTLIDAAELEAMPASPRLDMWGGNVPVGQVTLSFGGGGSGKSLLFQQLATGTALSCPILGIQTMSGVALYITCEDDVAELHRRQHDICRALGVSFANKKRRLALVSLTNVIGNELATFDQQRNVMVVMPRFLWLRDIIRQISAKLVVLDNVAHFFAGNENVRNQVAAFLGLLNMLAHETGAAIILIAHTNKAGDGSGSTAWLNQVRTALKLDIPTDGNNLVPDFDARLLTRIKSNYSRTGESIGFRWHQGAFKAAGDLPGDLSELLAGNAKAANDERKFLACLAERKRQRRTVSELVSKSYAPTVFARMAESESIGKFRLEQAMDRLFKASVIERGFLWRDTTEGKDRHGLRVTTANGPANHPPTRSANIRQLDRERPPTDPPTLPIYYVNEGGAADGQPPLPTKGEEPCANKQ